MPAEIFPINPLKNTDHEKLPIEDELAQNQKISEPYRKDREAGREFRIKKITGEKFSNGFENLEKECEQIKSGWILCHELKKNVDRCEEQSLEAFINKETKKGKELTNKARAMRQALYGRLPQEELGKFITDFSIPNYRKEYDASIDFINKYFEFATTYELPLGILYPMVGKFGSHDKLSHCQGSNILSLVSDPQQLIDMLEQAKMAVLGAVSLGFDSDDNKYQSKKSQK